MTIPFGGVEGIGEQQGRFGWILAKGKIRETSREGERNRKFVSDSSMMKFPLINSEEEEFKMALELCGPCPHCLCWPRSLLPAGVTGTGGCHLGIQPWHVQVHPEAATADTGPKALYNRRQEHLMAMLPPQCFVYPTHTAWACAPTPGTRFNPVQGQAMEMSKAQCP